jgi:hypothetical protein
VHIFLPAATTSSLNKMLTVEGIALMNNEEEEVGTQQQQ